MQALKRNKAKLDQVERVDEAKYLEQQINSE